MGGRRIVTNEQKKETIPIEFHKKLINERLVILIFSVNELPTYTSKEVEILHKYDNRCLEVRLCN